MFVILVTDRIRSTREGYVLTRVCPSMILSVHTWGEGYPSQVQAGGGVPLPGPASRGVPHLRYSPSDLARGVPRQGGYATLHTPHLTWPGEYPTSDPPCRTWPGGGNPTSSTPIGPGWGYPTLGTPHQTWLGGGYPTSGTSWLDLARGVPHPDRGGGYLTSDSRWST